MISGFIAKKNSMTAVFTQKGEKIAVSRLICQPLTVTKILDKSIQIAYGKVKKVNKPVTEYLKKNNLDITPSGFKEFKIKPESDEVKIGDQITVDKVFSEGDSVNVTGKSKGRGFAGVIKRHGFHRQPVSGGQSDRVRAPGSIGAQTPGKVLKGKKMPGHYGNKNKTVTNLKVISFNKDTNELLIRGSVPGSLFSWVTISKTK